MAIKKAQPVRLAPPPIRQWFYRMSLVLLVTVGVVLMIMDKAANPAVTGLRTSITDAVTPVLAVAARPMDALANASSWVGSIFTMYSENVALKNQNIQLLQWQAMAKEMEAENKSLHALLHVIPPTKRNFVTARVVSDLGGPYVHAALIHGGAELGIAKDQAVINDSGLVGRVVEAGKTSARVLLLDDINSRVPVIGETSREKSILAGNNNGLPTLSYLASNSKIGVGERIITSGDGGVFPPGVPVGVVAASEKGVVQVQPFVDATRLEYVSVVDTAQ